MLAKALTHKRLFKAICFMTSMLANIPTLIDVMLAFGSHSFGSAIDELSGDHRLSWLILFYTDDGGSIGQLI